LEADFSWINGKKIHVRELLRKELIPLAKEGLKSYNIKTVDIDKYIGILDERVKKKTNGAIWILDSYASLLKSNTPKDETLSVLTHAIMKNQKSNIPVHKWKNASIKDLVDYKPLELKVSEFMQTDLFTVDKDDILELVGEIMDWRKLRYMPVEDSEGNLQGLMTSRVLTRHFLNTAHLQSDKVVTVADVMIKDPITIEPDTSIIEAMKVMRKNKIGAIPVVKNNILAGLITETDFLDITSSLLERLHDQNRKK
jgi:predicted transcriptional regulator